MSEDDKRRLNRTQGKYGAGPQNGSSRKKSNIEPYDHNEGEQRPHNEDKEHSVRNNKKRLSKRSSQKHTEAGTYEGQTSNPAKSRSNVPETSFRVQYEENSEATVFSGLEDKPCIETIRNAGWHTLSTTEEGISTIYFEPDFIHSKIADRYFTLIHDNAKWLDKKVVINGEERPQPRLVAWYGPLPYTYSGVTLEPREFPPLVLEIKKAVEETMKRTNINVDLNSVLMNLYRDGHDSVAWHSDDETSMGIQPTIASVSLGETRRFELRRKPRVMRSDAPAEQVVHLHHGSLVVMDGVMQTDWQHRVPKEYHAKHPRINLTFRTVFPIEKIPRTPASDLTQYIKPPSARKESKPFQLEQEKFPPLGETVDRIQSKSHRLKSPIMGDEDSPKAKSITKDTKSHSYGKMETEQNNPKHGSPMNDSDYGIWTDSNESHVCDTHTKCSVANADVSVHPGNCKTETWEGKAVDDVAEFVPGKKQSSESQDQSYPESSNDRSNDHHKSNEHGPRRESSRSGSSNRGKPGKSYRHNASKEKCSEEEMIDRMNEVYDYISRNGDSIFYEDFEEVKVLMTVVENSENLPIHVIKVIAERLELLVHKAESYPNHNRGNSSKNRRYYKRRF